MDEEASDGSGSKDGSRINSKERSIREQAVHQGGKEGAIIMF
jgi:hypothetical protein